MKILDLFCGAGGASMGLYRAFPNAEIVGVDINPQPRYSFDFCQDDAMTFLLEGYDFIWASPPCQMYSRASQQWRKKGKKYPDLIGLTRERLLSSGTPYVIENVKGAPLINPIVLNGALFGLKVRRVRLFECSFHVEQPLLPKDAPAPFRMGRPVREGIDAITPVGHFSNVKYAQQEMEIPWMRRKDLAQAIPPAYSEYIGNEYNQSLELTAKKRRNSA